MCRRVSGHNMMGAEHRGARGSGCHRLGLALLAWQHSLSVFFSSETLPCRSSTSAADREAAQNRAVSICTSLGALNRTQPKSRAAAACSARAADTAGGGHKALPWSRSSPCSSPELGDAPCCAEFVLYSWDLNPEMSRGWGVFPFGASACCLLPLSTATSRRKTFACSLPSSSLRTSLQKRPQRSLFPGRSRSSSSSAEPIHVVPLFLAQRFGIDH